jgi:hypothetical protein
VTIRPPGAEAQNYPWCAHYGTGFEGMNCGFVTFQQCMDTVTGIGRFCMQNNTAYQPTPGSYPLIRRLYSYLWLRSSNSAILPQSVAPNDHFIDASVNAAVELRCSGLAYWN